MTSIKTHTHNIIYKHIHTHTEYRLAALSPFQVLFAPAIHWIPNP